MFNLRKKINIRNTKNRETSIESLLLSNPHHEWIRGDKFLFRFFKTILNLLEPLDFTTLNKDREICFLFSPGRYASALPTNKNYNFIILYPELLQIIKSVDNSVAFAIIFHELGHLFNEHHQSAKSAIQKQVEADLFAIKYGFENEILEVLFNQTRTTEIKHRIESIRLTLIKSQKPSH